MHLELDQAGAQSHSYPQCQAHPIPLYESDSYIFYVEGLQSQVSKLAIFQSQKNRTNCVTDHTKVLVYLMSH